MATLVPAGFPLSSLPESEQRVCRAFLDGLDGSWYVVPQVEVCDRGQDAEIDVVLVSPAVGALAVEVKGGVIRLEGGRWLQNDRPLDRSPVQQVTRAKHCLVRRLRTIGIELDGLFLQHAVALPDVGSVPPEGLGPDAPAEIVLAKPQLAFPADALARLVRPQAPVPPDRLARFLGALRPDAVLDDGDGNVLRWSRDRLDDTTSLHLANVEGLDANQRVLVTGGAGTGKTVLAERWARRAVARGERTLLVCFNKPIADMVGRRLGDLPATVSTFHDAMLRLLEPHGFRVGGSPTPEYWRDAVTDALAFHAAAIGTPFDTIVVDEAQDFHPHWLAALERLLDPAGPARLLVAADPHQAIYVHPWQPPAGMVAVPLVHNLRNCGAVAGLVQRLGGPLPLPTAPHGDTVVHLHAGGHREIRKRVRDEVQRLTGRFGIPPAQIAVLTTRTDVRDSLLREPPDGVSLVRWEERHEEAVLCETVQRTKGLERTAIVLVEMSGEPDPTLLYVGASRAIASLRLVGPPALAVAAGLAPGAASSR